MSIKDQQDDQPIGPAGEKLQKVLARIGVGSRRDVEAWISHGRIKVNGKDATLGQRVDMHDAITIDGKVIKREEAAESVRRVIMYNKPDGESAPVSIRKAVRPCSTRCRALKRVAGSTSVAWTSTPPVC